MKISVVIAAYNESGNIGPLTTRLISALDSVPLSSWELIYVIDGTDETREIAETFAARRPEIRVLHSTKPSGLAKAFRRGFDAVSKDATAVVTLDADLNHQPEEIPRLLNALAGRNADIVVGSRKVSGSATTGAPRLKRTVSDTVNRFMRRLAGMPVADMTSGFRVYSMKAFKQISFSSDGFAFLPEILIRAHEEGFRIVEEPIHFIFRVDGESKMRWIPTALSYLRFFAMRFITLGKNVVVRIRLGLAGSTRN
jgi:dolichol-phosphate mannosyltransferase